MGEAPTPQKTMNDLDQHLDAARSEYESLRYPGNLVADIAKHRSGASRTMRWTIGLAATAAAIAACVMIVVHPRGIAESSKTEIALVPEEATESVAMFSIPAGSAPSWSDVYSDVSSGAATVAAIVPPSWSVVPSEETLGSVESDVETTQQGSEDSK